MQKFYTEIKNFYSSSYLESDCNSISFVNIGTNPVVVNGLTLQQNQSLNIEGNFNEIDTTQYYISFSGAGTNNLAVIRKLYINE